MHIYLIRHGQSVANTGDNDYARLPDHIVPLSPLGIQQAYDAGVWLQEHCRAQGVDLTHARLWRSPFVRTRQTADQINRSLGLTDVREDLTLAEQQYGYFDALPEPLWPVRYPNEYAEYMRVRQTEGKFWARTPMGESPYDVAVRVGQFVQRIRRDEARGIDTLVVVTHGTALRAILMRLFDYTPEWYNAQHNPANCAIREVVDDRDLGYIH